MKIIGLTGGIASGKSTASKILKEMGANIIDTDELAHKVMEPEEGAWYDVVSHFGRGILNDDNTIDRLALGAIVFNHPEHLASLNQLTHPHIVTRLDRELAEVKAKDPEGIVFIEAPVLFEAGMEHICDEVWVVWVDGDTQIQRLMQRNGFSEDEARSRIASQMSLDEKAQRAAKLIDNSGDLKQLRQQTAQIFASIKLVASVLPDELTE